jgi:two-component system response regulator PilR (NtrC family)
MEFVCEGPPHVAAELAALLPPRATLLSGGARLQEVSPGDVVMLVLGFDAGQDPGAALAPATRGLARIAALAGASVTAIGAGLDRLPIAERCRLILEGVRTFIDTAAPNWRGELAAAVTHAVAADARRRRDAQLTASRLERVGLIGGSAALQAGIRDLLRIAPLSDLPVLVTGETGTGKEMVARALHGLDPRRWNRPFVPLNCAALSTTLAESELFGYRRGAFSGAERDRAGLIRAADGGVLLLDELGDLPRDLQAKLLRVLQERRVLPIGTDSEVAVDVRVIAATHRDLEAMVRAGDFRADLYQRISVTTLHLPPLRERREDLPALVRHFLRKHGAAEEAALPPAPEFMSALASLAFPGNVRELENLVRAALARGGTARPLTLADLPDAVLRELANDLGPAAGDGGAADRLMTEKIILEECGWNLERAMDSCEGHFVAHALHRCAGNQLAAASLLGVTPRTIYNKLRKHQIRGARAPGHVAPDQTLARV